jgi:lipid A 3-O-deacylase
MRSFAAVLLILCASMGAAAQKLPEASLQKGTWETGVVGSFSTGVGERNGYQFYEGAFRVGRVMTEEHGTGMWMGNFELAGEITPVMLITPDPVFAGTDKTIYAFAVDPLILKWNFTSNEKFAPWLEAAGGVIVTNKEFPEPSTGKFNFRISPGIGMNIFTREKRAVTVAFRAFHISNASLNAPNPGINAAVQVRVGYSWFH